MEAQAEGLSRRWAGPLAVAAAGVLWGTATPAAQALAAIDPLEGDPLQGPAIAWLRLAGAGPLFLAWMALTGGRAALALPPGLAWPLAALAASQAVYQLLIFTAVPLVGVTLATVVGLCGVPICVALLSWPLIGERLGGREWLAVALGVLGVGLLTAGADRLGPGDGAAPLLGLAAAAGAALAYALFTLASRHSAGRLAAPALIGWSFTLGAILLTPLAAWTGPLLPTGPAGWALAAHLVLVPTALAYLCYFIGMRGTTAAVAGVLVMLEPLTASSLAALLYGERIGAIGGAGAALLVLAALVVTRVLNWQRAKLA